MTKTKKVVAVMLAFLMIFSSASVLASAWDASVDDGNTLEISTKFFKEVDGQWVETEKVRPGDTVKARVYLGTDYYSNGSTLLFFYDKDFFTHAYSTSGPVALEVNSEAANSLHGTFAADFDMNAYADDNGLDSAFLADNSAFYVALYVGDGSKNVMFDDSTWSFEFTLTVAGDADGEGDLFVKESTIQSTTNDYAFIDVPKGPADGSAIDTWPMYLWDSTPVLGSQPVSTISSVTFNTNGGEFDDGTDSYIIEDLIDTAIDASTVPVPSMDGYSFMGWVDAADATPTYEEIIDIPAAIPEDDLVLNAYWMENVTITFDTDGGSEIAPLENVTPYADFADVAAPSKEGYTFVGWDVRGNMELPEIYPDVSTTYKAIWALDVTVSFNTNGGTEIAPIDGVAGEPFEAVISNPTKAGHNFIMWSPSLPTVFPEADTTYNAIFETKTYVINYYAVDEKTGKTEASALVQLEYGSKIPVKVPTLKLPAGKQFVSDVWYTDAECTQPLAEGATVEGAAKLYKKIGLIRYDAVFMVDDEEYARVETIFDDVIVPPADPAKEGFVFDGWSPDPILLDEPNDMYFTATWREAVNKAVYVVDGAQYEVYDVATGESLDVPADPYKEGYTFKGWSDVEGSTATITLPETMPTSTVTYYAVFEINEYTITFDTDGGSDVDAITQNYGTAITAPAAPTKTGYTFAGWAPAVPATMPAENMTITAQWTINQYTITFVDTGDVAYEAITQDYNTAIADVADPVKTGYTFKGWDKEIPENMPAEDITITATWEANSYDAVFMVDGEVYATVPTLFDSDIVAPAEPTKTGYTFGGWEPAVGKMDSVDGKTFNAIWNANGDTAYTVSIYTMDTTGAYGEPEVLDFTAATDSPVSYSPATKTGFELDTENSVLSGNVAADGSTNLVVKYIRNQYTFKTVVDGTETAKAYYFEEAVAATADPAKTGYTFTGWDGEIPATMPAEDVTLTAQWKVNSYNVTWTIDGAVTEETLDYGAAIVAPKAEKTGYSFTGWTPEVPETMPAEDQAFTAVFEANTYDAVFYVDGAVYETVPTKFDQNIVAPADPVKEGFVFSGWEPSVGMMDDINGKVYNAVWSNATDTPYTVNVYTMGTDGQYGAADVKKFTGETNTTAKYEPTITEGFVLNATSVTEGTIAADGSLVLNVYIDRLSYTFKAVSNGETMAEETYLYGATIAGVADPENKVGYTFIEWAPAIPDTMPANDLTVEAVFEANSDTEYKVVVNYTDLATGAHAEEFIYAGTSDNAIVIVDEIPDPAAEKTEYVLMSDLAVTGYSLDKSAANQLTGTVAADGSTVLNIYYVANKYSVTYDANGGAFADGQATNVVVLDYNASTVENAPEATREGYTFDGWNGPARVPANNAVKMTAKWVAKQYTITWVLDGTETVETYDCDATINKKAAPSKVGYTFDKWVDADGNEIEVPDTMPAKNLVIKTTYTINPHTVTWVNDGASEVDNYVYGDTIVVDTPVKEGYTFNGWFDDEGNQPSDYVTVPDKDLTFTAKWTINQYTITFADTGDSTIPAIKQDYATAITAPAAPSKTGYTFNGWDKEIPATMPATDMTITAQWTINQYTINFNADGGTADSTVTADYLSEVAAPAAPVKDGYTFGGWATAKGVTDPAQAVTFPVAMPLNGTTYYAIWTVNQYTINFNSLGGTPAVDSVTADYLSGVAKPATVPTKEGYTFGGWSETEGGAAVAFPYTMPLNGTTLYAIWNINSYTVTWDNDGATTDVSYEYNAEILLPTAPTKTGYTFKGWNGYTDGMKMPAENVTFTAVWEANSYDAVFFVDDVVYAIVPTAYDSNIVAPADPTKAGYTFNGWEPEVGKMDDVNGKTFNATWIANGGITYTVETYIMNTTGDGYAMTSKAYEGVTDSTVSVTPEEKTGFTFDAANSVLSGTVAADGSTKLVVKYIRNQYTFTTNVDGAKTSNDYYYEATVAAPATPVKEGYTFANWNPAVPATMPAENVEVVAQWTINSHDVIYYVDGVEYERITGVEYATMVTPIAAPTKTGYTFSGWDKAEAFAMPDEDVVISGTFTANNYTITFDTDGGSEIAPITQAYGSAVTAPADPEKSGYTFAGWYVGEDKVGVPATMPLDGIALTAKWTPNKYTVKFYLDETKAETVYTREADFASDYTVPTPTKEGYDFAGWMNADGSDSGLAAGATTQIPLNGAEYYATWTVVDYELVYNAGSGKFEDGKNTVTFMTAYGTAKADWQKPADPERAGYTFGGWNFNAAPATMPASRQVVPALWTQETYNVIFKDSLSDEVYSEGSYVYNDFVAIPDDPEKTGYTFAGWADAEGNIVTPADVMADIGNDGATLTYTATWDANEYTITFVTDGTPVAAITQDFGTAITADTTTTKAGYEFAGWADAEGNIVTVPATMPAEDMTLTATWTALGNIAYTVITYTMNSDGTTYAESSETLYGTAGETATAKTPAKEGFTLNAEKSTISGAIAGDGSLVLEVYYDRNKISVDVNGEKDEYFYDDKIEEPTPAPVDPNGGTFEGWEDEDGDSVDFPYNVPDEDDKEIIITPVYHYTVVYQADGAEVLTVKDRAGTALAAPEAPAKEGYRFIKWVDADGKTPADYGTMPEANIEFNAIYETGSYQVYYWINGSVVANKSAEYGETIVTGVDAETKKVNLVNYSTPEGYEFDGWYTDAECTAKLADGATVGASVVNLYAKETAGTYDAIFYVDGEVYATVPTVFETAIVLPEAPTKEGWTFTGWSPDAVIMDAEGMTFEATWVETEGAYTVTYYVDGDVYEEYALALGDELDVPADPFKKGYEFMGWATKADAVTADVVELPATMPAEDLVYYAVFELRSATVEFYVNKALDSSPYKSDETELYVKSDVMVGDIIEMPADPTNIDAKYYTFIGWTDVEGSDEAKYTAESSIEMIAEGITLYAVYERVGVKLVPQAGSTAVIERTLNERASNVVIESYNDNSVTTDIYTPDTEACFEQYYIYGLKFGLRDTALVADYVDVQGDGEIVVTAVQRGRLGTGTLVEVFDNVTGERVEYFYVVVFGDLDGNARLTTGDSTELDTETVSPSWSSSRTKINYMVKAANLDGNRRITVGDATILTNAVLAKVTIDQTTGLAE